MTDTPKTTPEPVKETAFRNLLDAFAHLQILHERDTPHEDTLHKMAEVRRMVDHHVSDSVWRERLHHAVDAAHRGEHEYLVHRFPAKECSDGGLAINQADAKWPTTLTGEAADVYRVWSHEVQPKELLLVARILDYPHGTFGEAGLFLSWARKA